MLNRRLRCIINKVTADFINCPAQIIINRCSHLCPIVGKIGLNTADMPAVSNCSADHDITFGMDIITETSGNTVNIAVFQIIDNRTVAVMPHIVVDKHARYFTDIPIVLNGAADIGINVKTF